jgi:16S rRNA A1518/A1519 N6-dimethyltransferase RsmA/KsgA/DIM1 with predicted DNA glycosylase/AP lyase activity
VASVLVTLRFPGQRADFQSSQAESFLEFVKISFAQKRKTLVNNLRPFSTPERFRRILSELKLREDARAEQLTVAQFLAVYRAISSAP